MVCKFSGGRAKQEFREYPYPNRSLGTRIPEILSDIGRWRLSHPTIINNLCATPMGTAQKIQPWPQSEREESVKRISTIAIVSILTIYTGLPEKVTARGFGGARFGGARVGGFSRPGGFSGGGFRSTHGVVGPYGGAGYQRKAGSTVVGPYGSRYSRGATGGSYTTRGGTTINYGAAGKARTGPFGGGAGRYVGGVQVKTPSGQTYNKFGTGGGIRTPGGVTVGGKRSIGTTYGPRGVGSSVTRSAGAIGPYGGGIGYRYKGGAAIGPYGGAAVGRTGGVVARTPYGGVYGSRYRTYYTSNTALRTQATYVRTGFRYYGAFTPAWYARYPRVWRPVRYRVPTVWAVPAWSTIYTYCGYPAAPVYYDYGSSVVYQNNNVYVNGVDTATAEQYSQQASTIAQTGAQTQPAKDEDWQPLGVFGMVEEGEQKAYDIFQLAIDKKGIIRGNYYNARTDSTDPVSGSVDPKSQRAAWTINGKQYPVYEAGIANLTKEQTTMLVHFSNDQAQQFVLVRLQQPGDEQKK